MLHELTSIILNFEQSVSGFLKASQGLPLPVLILLAFGGGLAASLTPCVLPMVPLYISYIGATKISSKVDALIKSSMFCLGSAIVFCIMGLFSSFASIVMIEYRGYVNVLIGIFILIMCLFLLEVIRLPLPQFVKNIPHGSPFIVGVAFSLVSSPCASPILFAILAMSAASGSSLGGALIMFAYSVGYTGIIFFTSIFAGFAKQLDFFKKNTKLITTVSSIVLAILGVFYLYSGIMWFIG